MTAVSLLHLEALLVVAPNRLDVRHHVVQIDGRKIDEEVFARHADCPLVGTLLLNELTPGNMH